MSSSSSPPSFWSQHCSLAPPLLSWFLFSSLLSLTNRKVFGHLNFPTPLLLTSLHFLIQCVASYLLTTYPRSSFSPHTPSCSNLPWSTYLRVALPIGIASALDIGLSNLAMGLIPLSVYTMVKSATPVFVLVLSFAMGLNKVSARLVGVVALIVAGEILTVKSPTEITAAYFNATAVEDLSPASLDIDPLACATLGSEALPTASDSLFTGVLLCLLASFSSAVRWTLLQYRMSALPPSLRTPLQTLRLLSPSMFFSVLLASAALEGEKVKLLRTCGGRTVALAVSGGGLAVW